MGSGGGFHMFDDTFRVNLRNMTLGFGLTVLVVGSALAVAFL
jgi:hypothetical protein